MMEMEPPPKFSYIENTLCRCVGPLNETHMHFLQYSVPNLRQIVFINDISAVGFVHQCDSAADPLSNSNIKFSNLGFHLVGHDESLIRKTIQKSIFQIMRDTNGEDSNTVLLVGDDTTFMDCVILSCMRRLFSYSMTFIISEFRFNVAPPERRLYDIEQFIESFAFEFDEDNRDDEIFYRKILQSESESRPNKNRRKDGRGNLISSNQSTAFSNYYVSSKDEYAAQDDD